MKTTFIVAIMATILSSVTATAVPATVNGFTLVTSGEGASLKHGEPALSVNPDPLCTRCVGHHGLCRIGDGSCYAPDGCYFCGGCGADRARCQTPGEACQCY